MIIEVIFDVIAGIIRAIFFATQVLPDMPSVVTNAGDAISAYAVSGISFVFEVVGKTFAVAILTIIPVFILFRLTWRITVFVWSLIRG